MFFIHRNNPFYCWSSHLSRYFYYLLVYNMVSDMPSTVTFYKNCKSQIMHGLGLGNLVMNGHESVKITNMCKRFSFFSSPETRGEKKKSEFSWEICCRLTLITPEFRNSSVWLHSNFAKSSTAIYSYLRWNYLKNCMDPTL